MASDNKVIRSYKDRIIDFGIIDGDFTQNGENIKYKSVVLRVEVDGEVEDLMLSGASAQKPRLLELTLKSSKKNPSFVDSDD